MTCATVAHRATTDRHVDTRRSDPAFRVFAFVFHIDGAAVQR
jgi:hypothetical protein